jgi:hypothetical protein
MVSLGKIGGIAALGLGILFLGNAIARPAQARLTGQALTESGVGLGSSLSSIGSGIGSLLGNVGTGSAQLLNPLFSLKTLVYGETPEESNNQIAQIENASNYSPIIPLPNTAAASPAVAPEAQGETRQSVITFPSGARTTYPLSQAAIDYYRNIGVEIS